MDVEKLFRVYGGVILFAHVFCYSRARARKAIFVLLLGYFSVHVLLFCPSIMMMLKVTVVMMPMPTVTVMMMVMVITVMPRYFGRMK